MLLLPQLASLGLLKSSTITVLGVSLIYTIAALGLNILLGYSGLVSLGTAGFMGLAAYFAAYFTRVMDWPFELSFVLAILIPTALGVLVGILSLRFEGIYLGIATLAIGEILREIFVQFDAFTNGTSGAKASYPLLLGRFQLDRQGMYYLIVCVSILVFILSHQLLQGRFGRALNAMRASQAAAQAMGIHVYQHRLLAFGLATGLAALAGVLYVHYIRISYPTTWGLGLSLEFLAIIVVGGFRSIFGTLIGASVIYSMGEVFLKQLPFLDDATPMIKGVLMILFVIYYPQGLAHLPRDLKMRFLRRRALQEGKAKKGGPDV